MSDWTLIVGMRWARSSSDYSRLVLQLGRAADDGTITWENVPVDPTAITYDGESNDKRAPSVDQFPRIPHVHVHSNGLNEFTVKLS